jgi:hypothetical protein
LHDSAAHEAAVDDGLQGFVALEQCRAGGHRVVGDHRVELATSHDVSVLRVHRV